jgi:hypothetical protein
MSGHSIVVLLFLAAFCSACEQKKFESSESVFPFYFDFTSEAERLNGIQQKVKKQLSSDSEKDTLIQSPDWEEELKLFIESNVDAKIYLDSYSIDSIRNSDSLIISLRSLDEDLEVKEITHVFVSGRLIEVRVQILKEDLLRSGHYQLNYRPEKGYNIEARLEIPFLLKKEVEINANFVN